MGLISATHLVIISTICLTILGPILLLVLIVFLVARPRQRHPGAAPGGWLPDPTHRHQLRFWDGRQWTAAVSDQGRPGTDPM